MIAKQRKAPVIGRSHRDLQTDIESMRGLRKLVARRQLQVRLAQAQSSRPIAEIARLTDTNHETTRRYLRGLSDPVPSFLVSFCDATGTSLDWLMRGTGSR